MQFHAVGAAEMEEGAAFHGKIGSEAPGARSTITQFI
jgi:hypothetical protein